MSRFFILAFAVFFVSQTSTLADEKTVEIPLKEIWALRMPGTRDLLKLDQSKDHNEVVQSLRQHIRDTWDNDKGVAVQGEGLTAFHNFHRLEVEGKKPGTLYTDTPVSLVFYTDFTSSYIHLDRVEKQGNRIVIRYRLIPHSSRNMSQHLAFIPLGKLPTGKYSVIVEPLPLEKKYRDREFPEPTEKQFRKASGSFQFTVNERS